NVRGRRLVFAARRGGCVARVSRTGGNLLPVGAVLRRRAHRPRPPAGAGSRDRRGGARDRRAGRVRGGAARGLGRARAVSTGTGTPRPRSGNAISQGRRTTSGTVLR